MKITFQPETSGEEEGEEEGGEDQEPSKVALHGIKAALEKDDPALFIKSLKLAMRCCKGEDSDEDDDAPASER